jgi:hypothetical protein
VLISQSESSVLADPAGSHGESYRLPKTEARAELVDSMLHFGRAGGKW